MPTGREIMERAGILLADEEHVRWPLPELCGAINEGVKAILLAKPNACTETRAISLVEGTLQTVPASAPTPLRLLDIVCNLSQATPSRVRGRMVTPTDRALLDSHEPHWHDRRYVPFRKEVQNFTFDEENPLAFYVVPGNNGQGIVEALLSVLPAALTASGDVDNIASYEGAIGLPEPYTVPLTDFVLSRAHGKDSTDGSLARANDHYAKFAAALGLKAQVDAASSPNRR